MLKHISLQHFAENEEEKTENEVIENENEGDGGTSSEETKLLTQKQIDDMINKAFARGARHATAGAKGTKAKEGEDQGGPSEEGSLKQKDDIAEKALEERERKAEQKLLAGTVRGLANDVKLTAKGANFAIATCNFSTCFDKEGTLDDSKVKEVLEQFVKDNPEFEVKANEGSTGFRLGAAEQSSDGSQTRVIGAARKKWNRFNY